jgi:hypothetical protein
MQGTCVVLVRQGRGRAYLGARLVLGTGSCAGGGPVRSERTPCWAPEGRQHGPTSQSLRGTCTGGTDAWYQCTVALAGECASL